MKTGYTNYGAEARRARTTQNKDLTYRSVCEYYKPGTGWKQGMSGNFDTVIEADQMTDEWLEGLAPEKLD